MLRTRLAHPSKVFVALAVAALGACGGDDGVSLSTVCNPDNGLFIELIDKTVECNQELFDLLFVSSSTADLSTACEDQFEGPLADGTVTFGSKDDAAACRRAIAETDCDHFDIDLVEECQTVLVGTRMNGEGCEADPQCEGDAFCDRPDANTCGVCVARKPDGASCVDQDECSGHECRDRVCTTPGDAGSACQVDDDCLGRLVCNHSTSTCQRVEDWKVGDTCTPDTFDCGPLVTNLYCSAGECTEFQAVGDGCGPAVGACNLFQGETCDQGTMKCVAPTLVGEGETCNLSMGRLCSDGLVCTGFPSGSCVAPARAGDSCNDNDANPCPGTFLLECVAGVCTYSDYQGDCPAE